MAHLCKSGQQPCGYQPQSSPSLCNLCLQAKKEKQYYWIRYKQVICLSLYFSKLLGLRERSLWWICKLIFLPHAYMFPLFANPPHHHQFLGLISLFFVFILQYHCKIEVVALFGPPSLLLCLASCVWVPGIPDRAGSFRCPFQRLNERKKQGRDEAS